MRDRVIFDRRPPWSSKCFFTFVIPIPEGFVTISQNQGLLPRYARNNFTKEKKITFSIVYSIGVICNSH
jgi:hypothetical protein